MAATKEKEKTASKEVGDVKNTSLALSEDFDFGSDAGAGMEGATVESFAIPFLGVLQKISPQCEESDAKYIPEARGGMLFNSVSSRLFDGKTGCVFLPVAYQRRFLRWGARGTPESGFKGEFMAEVAVAMRDSGEVLEQDGKLFYPLADGTIDDKKCDRLVDTRNHFGILLDPETGAYGRVVISISSTQIKKSKQLMTLLNEVKVAGPNGKVTPPTWFNKVRVTTVPESNDKGNWSGIKFALESNLMGDPQGHELYAAGKEFHNALAAGTAGPVQYADPEETGGAETGADGKF